MQLLCMQRRYKLFGDFQKVLHLRPHFRHYLLVCLCGQKKNAANWTIEFKAQIKIDITFMNKSIDICTNDFDTDFTDGCCVPVAQNRRYANFYYKHTAKQCIVGGFLCISCFNRCVNLDSSFSSSLLTLSLSLSQSISAVLHVSLSRNLQSLSIACIKILWL